MSLTTITKRAAAGLAVAGISIGIMAASIGNAAAYPPGPYATTGPAPTNNGVIVHDAPTNNGVIVHDAPTNNGVIVHDAPTNNGVIVHDAPTA